MEGSKYNYDMLVEMGAVLGPYPFARHYSNAGINLHFFVSLPPLTAEFIKFQEVNFDIPD